MKHVVHVNQHIIRSNRKNGTNVPPITVRTYKGTEQATEAIVRDKDGKELGRFVYRPDKPLSCGARLWFETPHDVEIVTAG